MMVAQYTLIRMNAHDEVFEIFSKLTGTEKSLLADDTLIADIVQDSLKYFELFLELERGLNRKLSFEQVAEIITLGDVVAFINSETNAGNTKK